MIMRLCRPKTSLGVLHQGALTIIFPAAQVQVADREPRGSSRPCIPANALFASLSTAPLRLRTENLALEVPTTTPRSGLPRVSTPAERPAHDSSTTQQHTQDSRARPTWGLSRLTMTSSTTFTPQTFAKLSPHPFLLANLQPPSHAASAKPTRTNGRAPHHARPLNINASSLSHAHGSAMVRIGDTSVICGVRGELLPTTSIPHWRRPKSRAEREAVEDRDAEAREDGTRELRDYDLLVPNIELATGCAPQFLPGVPPTTLAQTLSTRVYSLLHSTELLDSEGLRVWYTPPSLDAGEDDRMGEGQGDTDEDMAEPEIKAYWVLYIDVLFVSFDGNPFDAAWIAILAALRDTKLPRAWWDPDREMVLCSRTESRALNVRGLPIACTAALLNEREAETAGQSKSFLLVDPDRLEESLCDESITVVVDRTTGETRIRGISKSGGRVLGPKDIREIAGMAESRWEDIQHALG